MLGSDAWIETVRNYHAAAAAVARGGPKPPPPGPKGACTTASSCSKGGARTTAARAWGACTTASTSDKKSVRTDNFGKALEEEEEYQRWMEENAMLQPKAGPSSKGPSGSAAAKLQERLDEHPRFMSLETWKAVKKQAELASQAVPEDSDEELSDKLKRWRQLAGGDSSGDSSGGSGSTVTLSRPSGSQNARRQNARRNSGSSRSSGSS